ncbi:homoserine kinase [Chitinophagales bacterium]|nr:homoserine kinase [Chitinophagales bacterium]
MIPSGTIAINKGCIASAPASIGNLCVGFDLLGLCLEGPSDQVTAVPNESGIVTISVIHGDGGRLPLETQLNTAGVAAQSVLRKAGVAIGLDLIVTKGLPLGSGMGSSAASAVAAAVAANGALGNPFSKLDLLAACLDGEAVASGAKHGDNAFPCLLGGLLLMRGNEAKDISHLYPPDDFRIAFVHPELKVLTAEARSILPDSYSRSACLQQMASLSSFVLAIQQGDYDLMAASLNDIIAEPYRAKLIKGYDEAKQAAAASKSIGFGISGSGPSVFAICRGKSAAVHTANAMAKAFADLGIASQTYCSAVNETGAKVEAFL